MNWAAPLWLVALLGVLAMVGVVGLSGYLHRRRLGAVFGGEFVWRILPLGVRVRRALRDGLGILGLACAVIALAEPRFDKEIQTITARGTDLVFCVDLSRSMDAQDVDPSRLERARREIADLTKLLAGDRVGLVLYAGGAYPRLPLTEDYRSIELVLRESDTSTFEAQGSELGSAIRSALRLLANSKTEAGQAIIVFSDGESHDGDAAAEAAREAADQGVAVYTVGIGREASPIPIEKGRWLREGQDTVLTTPDASILKEVSRITGGAFVKSVASADDMRQLYQGAIRPSVRAIERDTQQTEVWRSAYQWPLGLALLFLLVSAWIGDGKRAFGAALGLLLVGLSGVPAPAMAGDLAEADALYRAGRFGEAAEQLTELSLERPSDAEIQERLAAARYRDEDYEGAARAFDQASRLQGDGDPQALFGSGNAHYLAGRLDEALKRYDQLLEADPDHPGATANREMLLNELEARRVIQPPPPPPPEPKDGEDEEQDKPSEEEQEEQQQQQNQQSEQQEASEEQQEDSEEQEPSEADQQENPDDSPSEQDANEDPSEGGAAGEPEESGPITDGEAHRLLDSVEEGRQKVQISGPPGGKPW
jgi:Ca-activated chloride channel homolog